MGSRYPEEEPFSFYDPGQDWEGSRAGPPHHRSAPMSPRGPISPRARPLGIYPPEFDDGYHNRLGLPNSPHERPYGSYDPEHDFQDRPKQGMGAPFRPSEVEPGYYNPGPQSLKEFDNRSRSVGRGVAPPPIYINPNLVPQGAPLNSKYRLGAPPNDSYGRGAPPIDAYGRGAPPNDSYGRGAPPIDAYGRGAPPNDNYGRGALPSDSYGRGTPPNDSYARGAPPNDNYGRGAPPSDSYGRGTPPSDGYGRGVPPSDGHGRGAPPSDGYGQGAPPNDGYGRGAPPSDSYGRGAPPSDSYGRGAPPNDSYRRGAPPNDNYRQGTPPNDNYGQGAPPNIRYGHKSSSNDIYEQGVPPNDTYGRGSLESGYVGTLGTPGNNYGAPASGTRPPYGEESSGYARGLGRGQGVAPLGDGRYEYGGLHQLERLDMAEDYNKGASQPAPISSEYAHQVYASVFSDPVYGGARQLNSQAGYHEEPNSLQQAHHREDVLRHPNEY